MSVCSGLRQGQNEWFSSLVMVVVGIRAWSLGVSLLAGCRSLDARWAVLKPQEGCFGMGCQRRKGTLKERMALPSTHVPAYSTELY